MKDNITRIAKEVRGTKRIGGGKKEETVWWTEVRKAVKKKAVSFRWMKRNLGNGMEDEAARRETKNENKS